MRLTWLDSNSWLIEISQIRILLDPWLVGALVFGNLPWLFEGRKRSSHSLPENIDLILLSQGLEDHAHPPTLRVLDHNVPVVASISAAKVCEGLGYTHITRLEHGQTHIFRETIAITAVPGAPVGPTTIENGYIIRDIVTGESIYYEPHGFHSPSLQQQPPVTAVITPLTSIRIPFVGPVIKGGEEAVKVCRWLKPQYLLPTAAGGDIEFQGLLARILKTEGSLEAVQKSLSLANLATTIIEPKPWRCITI
ncbi:MAG: MBL fold metallo-hydrolase [Geminocystis sp.]|nr:MBL fold metallo-hydrolase [Geminocystis sp.]MCS7147491.1 MBL fold metallo-hydrolase [Geminocystis sp.]MDW8115184.1 MBL fold metallo-hydrolase [Geminocystis sp.]MDW8464453.1 MBL fold metallo-hydrolase [Geminocystis sp.]